jgi:spermidine synthase
VLQIGLGSASLTRFLLRHRPKAQLTVVEITPQVIAAARQFFKLPEESPRLRIEVGDGHDYVAGTHRRFDLVLVDGFDAAGRAGMLETVPFYVNCRSRLHSGGMMAANLLTRNRGVEPIVARIREAFADRLLVLPPCDKGNTIVLASNGRDIDVASEAWREAARKLKAETALDLSPTLRRLFRQSGKVPD